MRQMWPICNLDMITSSYRDERFEEDHGVGVFLSEQSLVKGMYHMLCHDELISER